MEAKLVEIATKIGTPLALAGLTVVILFLLYRALLRAGLLSAVSTAHSFRIINRILTFVFIIALVAIVLGVASYLATSLLEPPRKASALEVTDLAVIDRPAFPVLDLKFRNLGRDVAYVKNVSLEILSRKVKRSSSHSYAGPSTWQYNVLLEPSSERREYDIPTSQVIPPNSTDRFSIVVGQLSGYDEIEYVDYVLRLRVLYNSGETSEPRDVKVRVYSPAHFLGPEKPVGATLEDRLTALQSSDPLVVAEIATVVGAVGNKEAVEKLLSVLRKDPDRYTSYYEREILPKPFYNERGLSAKHALSRMYMAIFWSLKQLTGDYQEGILEEMSPSARPAAEEALVSVKRS